MKRQLIAGLAATVAAALAAVPTSASAGPPDSPAGDAAGNTLDEQTRIDQAFGPAARAEAIRSAQADAGTVARRLGLSGAENLRVTDVVRDADGTVHVRYARTYTGLPVIGGDLITHRSPGGDLRGTDWASEADLSDLPSTKPLVSSVVAARSARHTVGLDELARQPRLVVYAVAGVPRLAWETVVGDVASDHERRVVYTDARTGALVRAFSDIQHAKGTGKSLYSGTVTLQTQKPAHKRYRLRDNTRGGLRTSDARNSDNQSAMGRLFTDADNLWGNGRRSSRQSAAVDAQFGAAKTWDFFKSRFNRNGIRGDGVGSLSRVHFGTGFDNAFWDDNCFCMTYGDGGSTFRPLVSLDVAGHEMTHGVTSHTAGLIYFGESGGLNEATSDIFGAMVEFSANRKTDRGDYYIGEKITKVAPGVLRRMDRPSADGFSYNCYNATMGRDDVHFTSGPANHFFYLLAEGSGAKVIGGRQHNSPTCNGARTRGIGRGAAANIWYRALNVYMTSTTDYRDARDATVRAARDLYGATSTQCAAVTRSWKAVSVPQQNYTCAGVVPGPSGANRVSNPGFESGNNGVWTASPGVITSNLNIGFPHRGSWWAHLNDTGSTHTDTLSQQIAIPAASKVRLRFNLLVATQEGTAAFDTLQVQVAHGGGTDTLRTYSNADASNSYTQRNLNLAAYAGQTVTLRFVGTEDVSLATAFLIDDVSVRTG
ncbi:MAG TPA: M4 family metallopeptidase [Nocardioidaceae bacterium]|nr:M4 family metallopeptidase [Nocardioidaceae bacterium]